LNIVIIIKTIPNQSPSMTMMTTIQTKIFTNQNGKFLLSSIQFDTILFFFPVRMILANGIKISLNDSQLLKERFLI